MNDRLRRWQARDRRIAAIHEAGHTVMARLEGVDAEPKAWRREPRDPEREMFWGGSTQYGVQLLFVSNMARKRIAVAGVMAEEIWLDGHENHRLASAPPPLLSLTIADWDTIESPCGDQDPQTAASPAYNRKPGRWVRKAAEQARESLEAKWEEVLTIARGLMAAPPRRS